MVKTYLSKRQKDVIELLGFKVENTYNFTQSDVPLRQDDRPTWWQKYYQLKSLTVPPMPEQLDEYEDLRDISTQPFLFYLLGRYVADGGKIDKDTKLNKIYHDLICKTLKRNREKYLKTTTNKTIAIMSDGDFFEVMQQVALCMWHGNTRTASVKEIKGYCEKAKILDKFTELKEQSENGVHKLLTSFYVRPTEYGRIDDSSFEFTHKSFGEYFVSKHLTEEMFFVFEKIQKEKSKERFNEEEALQYWLDLIGINPIDEALLKFMHQEIEDLASKKLPESRECIEKLISYTLREGYPAQFKQEVKFTQLKQHVNNATEGLFVFHSVLFWNADKPSNAITPEIVNEFCKIFYEITYNSKERALRYILNNLNLSNANLSYANLNHANLNFADLRSSNLSCANLNYTDIKYSKLIYSNLDSSNLNHANLDYTDLSYANVVRADLRYADLRNANLSYANLGTSNLIDAHISQEVLRITGLNYTDLEGTDLSYAILNKETKNKMERSGVRNIDKIRWVN